jgi:hypothetical protein
MAYKDKKQRLADEQMLLLIGPNQVDETSCLIDRSDQFRGSP